MLHSNLKQRGWSGGRIWRMATLSHINPHGACYASGGCTAGLSHEEMVQANVPQSELLTSRSNAIHWRKDSISSEQNHRMCKNCRSGPGLIWVDAESPCVVQRLAQSRVLHKAQTIHPRHQEDCYVPLHWRMSPLKLK